jgi:hypothetical protein
MSKSDLALRSGDAATALLHAEPYAHYAYVLGNRFTAEPEFILLRIDRSALDAYLASLPSR